MIGVKRGHEFAQPESKEVRYERGQKRLLSFDEPQNKLAKDLHGDKTFGAATQKSNNSFEHYLLIPINNQFCSMPMREIFRDRFITAGALETCVIYMENLKYPEQERLMTRQTIERIIVLSETQFGPTVQVQLMHHVKYLIATQSK